MKRSNDRILTTHAGSLPRPEELVRLYRDNAPDGDLQPRLKAAVADVVQQQRKAGVDIVGDGEFGKATRAAVDYGAWWSYIYDRMEGFEVRSGAVYGETFGPMNSQDRATFREFYESGAPMSGGSNAPASTSATAGSRLAQLVCRAPVRYSGHAQVSRDIENLKSGLLGSGAEEGFMPAVSPATLQIIPNEYYQTAEDYTWALAEAIRDEYRGHRRCRLHPPNRRSCPGGPLRLVVLEGCRPRGLQEVGGVSGRSGQSCPGGHSEDRVRFHICWGSWHGPHSTDVPLAEVADLLVKVNAQAYSVEAGNVRHEHEWKVWRDVVKLPEGKILIPGVVSHATNVLEHPELVADRLIQYAEVVGRENLLAGTDCGLGGRIHPQLVWAKLGALAEGAALASKQLWP